MKNNIITIFQDYKNNIKDFKEHYNNILELKDIIGDNNLTLEINGYLSVKNYVGFFSKNNTKLQILPKIFYKNTEIVNKQDQIKESLKFLYSLLILTNYFNIKQLNNTNTDIFEGDLLEIFINIFIKEFLSIYSKYIYQNYIQIEEYNSFIKGKILIAESIKNNLCLHNKHYISYDEYSINNLINRIIKTTVFNLLFKSNNLENKKLLKMGLSYLDEVDLINITNDLLQSITLNRHNNEIKVIFELAKLFYFNLQPGFSFGDKDIISFLIPMEKLFERFVYILLRSFENDQIKLFYQNSKYITKSSNEKESIKIKPDFIFKSKQGIIHILDAKYKNPFNKDDKLSISNSDIYQLITYASSYQCYKLTLIYPKFWYCSENDNLLEKYIFNAFGNNLELNIIQIDITETNLEVIKAQLHDILRI